MKKLMYLCFLLITVLLVAVGCSSDNSEGAATDSQKSGEDGSGGDGDKIELRMAWWGGQERHDRTLKVIELYEEQNPNIKITPEYSGIDGYFDKLTTQFAAGNAPDIVQYGGNLNDFINKGVVLPLDEYVGNEIDTSKHNKSMIDAATLDDKFYGVTLGTNAFSVLINKTKFEEANVPLPGKEWTWEDMVKAGKKITESIEGTYGVKGFGQDGFSIFLAQKGKIQHVEGKLGFNEKDIEEYFRLFEDMRDSGAAVLPEIQAASSETPEQSLIVQGDVAMELVSSNQYAAFNEATEDELMLHIFPYNAETGKHGVPLRPSQFLSGSKNTEHPKEVAKFLNFMVNDEEATAILGNNRGAPVNSEIRKKLIATANESDQVIFEYIDWVDSTSEAPYVPNLPGYNENEKLFKQMTQKIAFEETSVQKGAEEYYQEVQKIVEKFVE